MINDFFDGGTSLVAYRQLGGDVGTPTPSTTDPDDALLPTSTPYLSAFFGINNNILNPDGSESPGLFGASGVVLQRLLGATNGDGTTQSLIHGFFETGISEVVRQILVEPQATAPATPPEARTFIANAAVDPDPKPVVVEKRAKIAAPVVAAPVAPVVASPPQTPDPVKPVVVKTEEVPKANDVTDAMKNGNKVEVDPVLLEGAHGGTRPGEGSWGVFGQVADAIGKAVTGAVAPKKSSTGSTGTGGS